MGRDPYYQDDDVTIYHGDCMDVLHEIESVDITVSSPPYNMMPKVAASGMLKESNNK